MKLKEILNKKSINEEMSLNNIKTWLQNIFNEFKENNRIDIFIKVNNKMATYFNDLLNAAPSKEGMREQDIDKLTNKLAMQVYNKFTLTE